MPERLGDARGGMTAHEHPPELVERCARVQYLETMPGASGTDWENDLAKEHWRDLARIVLDESGHTELVAALRRVLPYVAASGIRGAAKAQAQGEAALKKAGAAWHSLRQ